MSTLARPATPSPTASMLLVTQARLRTLRTPGSRLGAWVALIAGCWALLAAGGIGDTMRALAESDLDVAATAFARAYLVQYAADSFASTAAWVLAVVVCLTVIAPALAPPATRLLGGTDAVGLPLARMTRFVDAAITHLTSLTTIIALLACTALASMVTVDGQHRARALLIAWGAWVAGVALGAGARWVRELIWPKVGHLLVALAVAGAACAWVLDPTAAKQMFGAGEVVVAALRTTAPLHVATVLVGLCALGLGVGWWACRRALARPQAPAATRSVHPRRMPAGLAGALWAQLWRTAWRTKVVRGPLLLVCVGASALAVAGGDNPVLMAAVVVSAPLMVTLAFGVNTLALLGGSGWWVSSLPRAQRIVLGVHTCALAAAAFTCATAGYVMAFLAGRLPAQTLALVVACAGASALVYTGAGTWCSMLGAQPTSIFSGQAIWSHARTVLATVAGLVVVGVPVGLALSGEHLVGAQLAPTVVWAGCAIGAGVGAAAWGAGLWVWAARATTRAKAISLASR